MVYTFVGRKKKFIYGLYFPLSTQAIGKRRLNTETEIRKKTGHGVYFYSIKRTRRFEFVNFFLKILEIGEDSFKRLLYSGIILATNTSHTFPSLSECDSGSSSKLTNVNYLHLHQKKNKAGKSKKSESRNPVS